MWSFEGAELTAYFTDDQGRGQSINLDISPMQLKTMFKAVGIELNTDGTYTAFGDNTLKKIMNGEINPFRLEKP